MARLIVVEDDPVSARVIERALARMGGHQVRVVEDGEEVLRACEADEVDLLLMDCSLANTSVAGRRIDGVELTRLVRERCDSRRPPVILVTAHAMHGDRERLLEASGADAYLPKPIVDHAELIALVARLLGS